MGVAKGLVPGLGGGPGTPGQGYRRHSTKAVRQRTSYRRSLFEATMHDKNCQYTIHNPVNERKPYNKR